MPPPRKCIAFTLAEVLITLGIIGVVAALTIPTLFAEHQKLQTVTQLKKAYSILGQALKLAETEYGEISTWDLYSGNTFKTNILPYLNKTSYCEDCKVAYTVKQLNGEKANPATSTFYSQGTYKNIIVYLADGIIIATSQSAYNNTHANTEEEVEERIEFTTPIIPITVDINGEKGPNKYGKDIFMLELNSKYGLRQYGYGTGNWNRYGEYKYIQSGQQHSCNKNADFGYWCAAKIILDGWQIKDDYPW